MTDRTTADDNEPARLPKIIGYSLSDLREMKDSALGAAIERLILEVESTGDKYAAFGSAT
jgi:FXSXX-COOH protein